MVRSRSRSSRRLTGGSRVAVEAGKLAVPVALLAGRQLVKDYGKKVESKTRTLLKKAGVGGKKRRHTTRRLRGGAVVTEVKKLAVPVALLAGRQLVKNYGKKAEKQTRSLLKKAKIGGKRRRTIRRRR